MRSREARNVFTGLAELSVHGANVQKGQIVLVQAEIGLEEQAHATAEAAHKRGAKFVDVAYFDPYLKRVRIESAFFPRAWRADLPRVVLLLQAAHLLGRYISVFSLMVIGGFAIGTASVTQCSRSSPNALWWGAPSSRE